jgi:hypothetical protein
MGRFLHEKLKNLSLPFGTKEVVILNLVQDLTKREKKRG